MEDMTDEQKMLNNILRASMRTKLYDDHMARIIAIGVFVTTKGDSFISVHRVISYLSSIQMLFVHPGLFAEVMQIIQDKAYLQYMPKE